MKTVNSQRTPVTQVQVTINLEKTGEQLKTITKEKGYEVRDLMTLTGYSSQAVYKWFNGKSLPSIDTLVVLSSALNMEINELLVIDGEFVFCVLARNRRFSDGDFKVGVILATCISVFHQTFSLGRRKKQILLNPSRILH